MMRNGIGAGRSHESARFGVVSARNPVILDQMMDRYWGYSESRFLENPTEEPIGQRRLDACWRKVGNQWVKICG